MEASADYYEVLGLPRDYDDQQIKRAYRKLAVRWHPDKNPDRPEEAEAMFKQVAEAYEVLSDPNKRTAYDHRGRPSLSGGGGGGGFGGGGGGGGYGGGGGVHGFRDFGDAHEIFRQFFGGRDPFSETFGGTEPVQPGAHARAHAHAQSGMGGGMGGMDGFSSYGMHGFGGMGGMGGMGNFG